MKTATYEGTLNLALSERGGLAHTHNGVETVWHPQIEIPPAPAGVSEEAWQHLHQGFTNTSTLYLFGLEGVEVTKTVFEMTEAERIQWCAEYDAWSEDETLPSKSERDLAWERDYYAGGNGAGLDPFAYDSQGNDTGLRMKDFI